MGFSQTLADGFSAGKHLCVGIDPHDHLLADWSLDHSAAGAEHFGRAVVEAAAGIAIAVKPQIAFFERFGAAGFAALERVLADARSASVPVIADVKRGDIGTSFAAYAQAWLQPGSPLECDAMTAVAYQGFGSLTGALDLVREHDKGLFVLAATSNPEAAQLQKATLPSGPSIASHMVTEADAWNQTRSGQVGSVGVVLGATLDLSGFGIDTERAPSNRPVLPVLAPGFGAQGARIEDVPSIFGRLAPGVIANESRSVLQGGESQLRQRIIERDEVIRSAGESWISK